jgi:hypothetical protein
MPLVVQAESLDYSPAEYRGAWAAMQLAEGLYWLAQIQHEWPRMRDAVRGLARSNGMTPEQLARIERMFEVGAGIKLSKLKDPK